MKTTTRVARKSVLLSLALSTAFAVNAPALRLALHSRQIAAIPQAL